MRRNLYSTWLVTATLMLASLFFATSAQATHAVGSDMTYVCLSPNVYRFTMTFYYDCASPFTMPASFTANVTGCGAPAQTFSLNQLGPPIDITPICPTRNSLFG